MTRIFEIVHISRFVSTGGIIKLWCVSILIDFIHSLHGNLIGIPVSVMEQYIRSTTIQQCATHLCYINRPYCGRGFIISSSNMQAGNISCRILQHKQKFISDLYGNVGSRDISPLSSEHNGINITLMYVMCSLYVLFMHPGTIMDSWCYKSKPPIPPREALSTNLTVGV